MQAETKSLLTVGDKVRKIREIKGFTQEYLATKLHISQNAYSKIELGKTKLSIDKVGEICSVLEVDIDTLLNFDDKQIFNNCQQSGNMNHIYNYHSDQLKELYEKLLMSKDEEIKHLRELLKKSN
jgi:transcriptional regulator with XRE-family HTH domain